MPHTSRPTAPRRGFPLGLVGLPMCSFQRLTEPLAPADIADCGRRLKAASDETATLEERWLELSTELDGASA